jgi:type I restriction-modification system DNA methylase subunit
LAEFNQTNAFNSSELTPVWQQLHSEAQQFQQQAQQFQALPVNADLATVKQRETALAPLAETSRNLIKSIDHLDKLTANQTQQALEQLKQQIKSLEQNLQNLADQSQTANTRQIVELAEQEKQLKEQIKQANQIRSLLQRNRKAIEYWRKHAVEQLKQVRYFYKQADWLLSRFPDGELADVLGLVKLVDMSELEAADWSLTPGRYVGVAPEEIDEEFDFEEALRDIHIELKGLNEEAAELAAQIAVNFEELGV